MLNMNDIEFYEINKDSKESIIDLINFYTKIYLVNFPDDNERESLENLLIYLRNNKNEDIYKYHIVIEKYRNKIIGGAIFDYYIKNNYGIIEYITIDKQYQSQGYGELLYNYICNILNKDSNKYNKKMYDYIFGEIKTIDNNYIITDKKYIHFWNKYNFKRINIHYIQPPLSRNKESVNNLCLIVVSPNIDIKNISVKLLKNVIYEYFKYSIGIEDPKETKEYKFIEKELSNNDRIEVNKII